LWPAARIEALRDENGALARLWLPVDERGALSLLVQRRR